MFPRRSSLPRDGRCAYEPLSMVRDVAGRGREACCVSDSVDVRSEKTMVKELQAYSSGKILETSCLHDLVSGEG